MNYEKAYWYAVGYYDGRSFGEEQSPPDEYRLEYKQGFDKGVSDYCQFDED